MSQKTKSNIVGDSVALTGKILATIRESGAMQMIAISALKAAIAHMNT